MGGSFDYDISVNTSSLEAQLVSSVFQNVSPVSSLNFTQSTLTELMNFGLGDSTTSVSQVSVIVIGIWSEHRLSFVLQFELFARFGEVRLISDELVHESVMRLDSSSFKTIKLD